MSEFANAYTCNEPFIKYEQNGEEWNIPAVVEDSLIPNNATIIERYEDQWFARLSNTGVVVPGPTVWMGPYPTEDAALYDLWFAHGDDKTFYEFLEGEKHIVAGSLHLYGLDDNLYGWSVENFDDIFIASLGFIEDGYDPNDDAEALEQKHDFKTFGAIDTANLKKRFENAEKAWRGQ